MDITQLQRAIQYTLIYIKKSILIEINEHVAKRTRALREARACRLDGAAQWACRGQGGPPLLYVGNSDQTIA